MKTFVLLSKLVLLVLITQLSGCAAVAISGAAAAATDKRTTGTLVEDQTIELKAIKALADDAELREQAHFNITSYNSVVLLSGETPTEAMRQRAVKIVSEVEKVNHVYNELTIAAPSSILSRSSDTYLTAKVKTKLLAHEEINGLQIKVNTERGIVYLMGIVSRADAEIVTDIVRKTSGVQKVVKLFQYEG